MKCIFSCIVTTFSIFLRKMKRAIEGIKAYVHALQQPYMQYHIALLLAMALAFLLGWPLFFSTLPHVTLTILGHGVQRG